jgi:hypothetical protein
MPKGWSDWSNWMAKTTELEAAYRATTYRVYLPGGHCDLRPGVASDTLRCWLETNGATGFAILTACNPGSVRLDEEENASRQSQLECELLESGYETYVGENVAEDAAWPVEESCFVPGIPVAEAMTLGGKYGQNAVVCGGADGVPELVWLGPAAATG